MEKFKVIVEMGQGHEIYLANDSTSAFALYQEKLDEYPQSQIHLMREIPMSFVNPSEQPEKVRMEKHKQIDSRYLQQITTGADPSNPLYEKIVVMSGTFEQIGMEREQIADAIQHLGAKLNRGVSRTMQVFVMGNKVGPSKLKDVEQLRADGHDIRILSQLEFREIIKQYLPGCNTKNNDI